ncbi:MAG: glycoside hydrolase [Chloroflexaceae bacterium]|nr:glycoside hydrolase [Chloroflexaceae bacterium]NJL35060.1 glycoside hydrolase [Chloroflexaceae bacterium]NJO06804.1 glycoside hydrolase [Chloroflexaceae bacterium]
MIHQQNQTLDTINRWALTNGLVTHPLPTTWQIRPLDTFTHGSYPLEHAGWHTIELPSHWQQHPDLRQHTGKVAYACRFAAPPLAAPATRAWLRFNGVFYQAHPYLNGRDLGRHEGYFAPFEYEVTDTLHAENTLLVEVDCPEEHNKLGKRMITGVFSHWDCIDPTSNPGGIWLPVDLHYSGPTRMLGARCHTDTLDDQIAQIRYRVDLDTNQAGSVVLRWTFTPRTFNDSIQVIEHRRTLQAGRFTMSGLLKLRNPRLWWTHDLGRPDLYTVTLEVLLDDTPSDQTSFVFGVRTFELRNWIAHLNGVRFLIKGNNYAPGDTRIATMTYERCAQDIELARACNMNLLRVHAHVDHPTLYHAANEAGMLLWQDMPLQWLYNALVLPEAERQTRAMVHQLYNHPSVVIWCMHNEPIFVADTNDETVPTRARTYASVFGFSWNRDVMDTALKRVAEREDPTRPVVRSSGEFYVPFVRDGTDAHAYFGWYATYGTLRDLENALRTVMKVNIRFVTEFGAQSFPNLESSLRFMSPAMQDIDIDYLNQYHGFQAQIMDNWIPWRTASTLQEIIDMSQDYQIFINRYYIDRLRYYKYRPTGGIVPFMFIDPYPAILWSIVDYWRVPKRSYYAMQMAFAPQYAFTLVEARTYAVGEAIVLPIYAVNDAQHPVYDVHLSACLCDPAGAAIALIEHRIALDADCLAQEIDRLRLTTTTPGTYTLDVTLTNIEQETRQVYDITVA